MQRGAKKLLQLHLELIYLARYDKLLFGAVLQFEDCSLRLEDQGINTLVAQARFSRDGQFSLRPLNFHNLLQKVVFIHNLSPHPLTADIEKQ